MHGLRATAGALLGTKRGSFFQAICLASLSSAEARFGAALLGACAVEAGIDPVVAQAVTAWVGCTVKRTVVSSGASLHSHQPSPAVSVLSCIGRDMAAAALFRREGGKDGINCGAALPS